MRNERLDGLFTYLDLLQKLHEPLEGYLCAKEISECIAEIRAELEIGGKKAKKPTFETITVHAKGFDSGGQRNETRYDLTDVPTAQLADELAKRDGVKEYCIGPHGEVAQLTIDKGSYGNVERIEGPARIIVNKD